RRRREESARDLDAVPALQRAAGAGDGADQRRGRACRARCRGRALVRGNRQPEPDRDCDCKTILQPGFRIDPRHLGDGHAGAEPVLSDRGIARGRESVFGKAQAEIPLWQVEGRGAAGGLIALWSLSCSYPRKSLEAIRWLLLREMKQTRLPTAGPALVCRRSPTGSPIISTTGYSSACSRSPTPCKSRR